MNAYFYRGNLKLKKKLIFNQFIWKNYFNPLRIKQAAFYENMTAVNMYNLEDDSIYLRRSSRSSTTDQASKDYLFKNLFHGFRYLDFAEQLIQTRSIHDF